jgi:hypothetical protein
MPSDMLFVALCPTADSPCLVDTPEALYAYGVLDKILDEHHMFVGNQNLA